MFTGLIKEVGLLASRRPVGGGLVIQVECPVIRPGISIGDSIAVDGICLTARGISANGFSSDLSRETLNRSTFNHLEPGHHVNLEPALAVGDRLGGHFVQGHVDGLGRLEANKPDGSGWEMTFSAPPELLPYLVEKGSVAVNGISLTVSAMTGNGFRVAIIPHTFENTNLKHLRPGGKVNLEVDILAKYVSRLLRAGDNDNGITVDFLRRHGFDG